MWNLCCEPQPLFGCFRWCWSTATESKKHETLTQILDIIVSFIPLYSYFKDSFLPIGTLLAKGKPPASQNSGTSSEVDAFEPFRGILSGSSDRVSEAIGLTREGLRQIHWCCLDAGRSRKLPQQSNHTEPKSGRSWHRVTHTHTHTHTDCPWRIPRITVPTVVCKHNCWWCIQSQANCSNLAICHGQFNN